MIYHVEFFALNTWHDFSNINDKARTLAERKRAFLYLEHCFNYVGKDCPVRMVDGNGYVWKVLGYFKYNQKGRKRPDERNRRKDV